MSPHTTGDDQPRPGTSAAQATFSLSDHLSGTAVSRETPEAASPRNFLQNARTVFEDWLDGPGAGAGGQAAPPAPAVVTAEAIDALIRSTLVEFESGQRAAYAAEIPVEQDFFGRVRNLLESVLAFSEARLSYGRAACGNKVMPPNLVVRCPGEGASLCVAVLNAEGFSLALERIYQAANGVDENTMALQYLDMMKALAAGPSTKWVLPMELTSFVQGFARNMAASAASGRAAPPPPAPAQNGDAPSSQP